MKIKKIPKIFYTIFSIFCILILWQIASNFLSSMILPSVKMTSRKLIEIFKDEKLTGMIFITLGRLFTGLLLGVVIGVFSGVLMGRFETVNRIFLPIIGILQTVPPVSWLILALIWLGFNGKPAIFILTITIIPIIAINISQGFKSIDQGLMEMATVYNFSNLKIFFNIIKPSVMPYFKSGCLTGLGIGWKIVVMGEVLTTTNGIGGMIQNARLNVEIETVMAWSIIILFLFYISRWLLEKIFSIGDAYDFTQKHKS